MRWYSIDCFSPSGAVTDCFVRTRGGGLHIANNETMEDGGFRFICNRTDQTLENVTHFCIPDPVETKGWLG